MQKTLSPFPSNQPLLLLTHQNLWQTSTRYSNYHRSRNHCPSSIKTDVLGFVAELSPIFIVRFDGSRKLGICAWKWSRHAWKHCQLTVLFGFRYSFSIFGVGGLLRVRERQCGWNVRSAGRSVPSWTGEANLTARSSTLIPSFLRSIIILFCRVWVPNKQCQKYAKTLCTLCSSTNHWASKLLVGHWNICWLRLIVQAWVF